MLFHYAPFELEENEEEEWKQVIFHDSLTVSWWSSNSEKISQINMVQRKTKNTTICFNR